MPYAYRSPRAGAWNAQAQPGYEVFVDETENEVLVDDRSSSSALRAGKKHHGLSFKGSWRQLKSGYKSFSRRVELWVDKVELKMNNLRRKMFAFS